MCAAASAVSFGAVNGIITLTGITPAIQQGEDGGYLKVVLPETEYDHDQQVIMRDDVSNADDLNKTMRSL